MAHTLIVTGSGTWLSCSIGPSPAIERCLGDTADSCELWCSGVSCAGDLGSRRATESQSHQKVSNDLGSYHPKNGPYHLREPLAVCTAAGWLSIVLSRFGKEWGGGDACAAVVYVLSTNFRGQRCEYVRPGPSANSARGPHRTLSIQSTAHPYNHLVPFVESARHQDRPIEVFGLERLRRPCLGHALQLAHPTPGPPVFLGADLCTTDHMGV